MEGDSEEGGSRMDGSHGTAKTESQLSSPAAFVEGGIQEACEDACSICLEAFCESDPSTVTSCKHEFHLQCILEWCQRSSQCPMCWQSISMKDPTSQELLEAVEQERSIRVNRSRNATIFHHPMLGDFEFQQLPPGADDTEFEERIIQHLAAAAAMGRTHRIARREGHRGRSGAQGHPQFIFFSTDPNGPSMGSASAHRAENEPVLGITAASPSAPHGATEEEPVGPGQADEVAVSSSWRLNNASRSDLSNSRSFAGQTTPVNQDVAGPSDFHSFSESLKSRLSSVSMRYRDSITKSTRGWKERLFSRNTSMADLGSEVRREVSAGIATVSRMIERLETRDSIGTSAASNTDSIQTHPVTETSNERAPENHSDTLPSDGNISASCAASSASH